MSVFSWWPFRRFRNMTASDLRKILERGDMSKAGKYVTQDIAIKVAAVFACVRVISEDIAQVPFKLYREVGRNKLPAKEHPLYELIHRKPNDITTSFAWRETLAMHAALAGSGYCFVNRSGNRVLEILNLEPGTVRPEWPDRLGEKPVYVLTGKSGEEKRFPAESILCINGPAWGIEALEPVKIAREVIGLSVALEESTARLHKNGVRGAGLLSIDGTLTEKQYQELRTWLEKEYEGSSNAYRTMILDRGAKFASMVMSSIDAQQLESRRFQIEEICRYFRVLPIMVCSSDKATTYASAEQMFLAHVVHTLSPWYARIEQAVDCQLLTEAERRQGYYTKFTVQGLLRGALKDTAEYLYRLASIGMITRNEGRSLLEFNPLDGLDEPLTPANMVQTGDSTNGEDLVQNQ